MKNKIFSENKSKTAFTLIELMVVVAVIAILATLGVTNFNAAIKRTRNSGRQADMLAVSKALETCYDVPSGSYGMTANLTGTAGYTTINSSLVTRGCLNVALPAKVTNYDYFFVGTATMPQSWVVCAALEPVANVSKICNHNAVPTSSTLTFTAPTVDTAICYFCVKNQQ